MAFKISVPFLAFQLKFQTGESFLVPYSDKEALRVGQSFALMTGQYAEVLQRELLNKGKVQQLLGTWLKGDFTKAKLSVSFPAAMDGYSFPAFELDFDYFYWNTEKGTNGIVPALGVEVFSESSTDIAERLVEAIKTEFSRKKKLAAVQHIVSAIWFHRSDSLRGQLDLKALSPSEVEEAEKTVSQSWLPKVAQLLQIQKSVLFGMEKELEQLLTGIKSKFQRSLLLVGASGVGKTTLVWELSYQMRKRRMKEQIWETTASTLIKDLSGDTGSWENNLSLFCNELAGSDNLLFVRNLMELFEVGQYVGNNMSMAEFLRNAISRGEVVMISECTEEELARIELKSNNFLSFFNIIRVAEPTAQLEDIILKKVQAIAEDKNIRIEEEAVREVIRLHRRFMLYAGMPGKPIRFLESLLLNEKRLQSVKRKALSAISKAVVLTYFCEETGIPRFMVDPSIPMNLSEVSATFNQHVFGQEKAVRSVVNVLVSVKAALSRGGKPIASFLFVGPTGVGKTELAKALAGFMFGNRQKITRFDMSEFSDPDAALRLIGSSYFTGGVLTAAVRREPFSVLLFDEIEKAHPSFYDLLLQILDEGRLSDSQGKVVNFCSTIIIMTSNIGAGASVSNRIAWNHNISAAEVSTHFMSAVQKHFRPELFNRIDEVIPFEPLSLETIRFVVEREITLLKKREGIQFRRMDVQIADSVFDFLGKKGYHAQYGARYLQRVVREQLVIPLAQALNNYDFDEHLAVQVLMKGESLHIEIEESQLSLELLFEELEKATQANATSSLRRKIKQTQDGYLFTQLINRLDALEQKRRNKKFWENKAKVAQYNQLLGLKETFEKLMLDIESAELSLGKACLNLGSYDPALFKKVETWQRDFFHLKTMLCHQLRPEYSLCQLAIYGRNLVPILDFYKAVLQKKGFRYEAYAVWFREYHYNQQIQQEDSFAKKELYVKSQVNLNADDWDLPPQKNDMLCGVEMSISGACAYLYLLDEGGMQRWAIDSNDYYFMVSTSLSPIPTPEKVHRKEFYNAPPRRIYAPPVLKDTSFKINREIPKVEFLPVLLEEMDKSFSARIELAAAGIFPDEEADLVELE